MQAANNRPNIVFVLADDLGYGDVGYNGGPAETPNLDAVASGPHSIKFTHFYSGAPVCSPTRGTLLTGRNHNRYCIWTANTRGRKCKAEEDLECAVLMPLPTSEVTVAEILKDHGYRTATFGKWHLGDLKPVQGGNRQWPTSHPGQHGFDTWKVTKHKVPTANPNCRCFNVSLCRLGHYTDRPPPCCGNYYAGVEGKPDAVVAEDKPIIGDDSEYIVGEFAQFLKDAVVKGHPFFAYIAFHAVHIRYVAVPPFIERYTKRGHTADEVDYYGSISAMDRAVGRIRELLSQYHVSNNTMLWFVSDNGPKSKTPGRTGGLRGRKGSLYEGGIRVPGIIEWPGVIKQNRISAYPVVTSDFLPTVCDILGTKLPQYHTIDGISVLPVLLREIEVRRKPIAWAFNILGNFSGSYNMALIDNEHKAFVEYRNGRRANTFLYNIHAGYSETQDISPFFADKLHRMLAELESWRLSIMRSAEIEVGCT